jgi:hypothetical protein
MAQVRITKERFPSLGRSGPYEPIGILSRLCEVSREKITMVIMGQDAIPPEFRDTGPWNQHEVSCFPLGGGKIVNRSL